MITILLAIAAVIGVVVVALTVRDKRMRASTQYTANSVAQTGLQPWQGALAGVAAGIVYGIFGFFFLRQYESPHMGEALFIILPLVVGATIALLTPRPITAVTLLSSTIALLIVLISLISLHVEGILCAVLAFPVIFVPLVLGVGVGLLLRELIRPFQNTT